MSAFVSQSLRTGLAAAGLMIGLALSPAFAQNKPADGVIAKGSDFTVTEKDLKEAMNDPMIGVEGLPDDQKREAVINYLIDLKVIGRAAAAAKVDQSPDFTKRLEEIKQQMMAQAYVEQELKKLVTPEAVRALYDETIKDMKPEQEVRARHILVDTEDQAKAVVERLKKGEDFAKVAADVSKDTGSKESGGELGFFTKDRMVAPFAEAAFKLQPKQISEPVKTEFGYHIIETEEKRDRPVPSFDDLKPQIEAYLTRQSQQKVIGDIRKQAGVQRLDKPANPHLPMDGKPADSKPSEAKPADAKPSDAKPSDAKPAAPAKK